MGATAQVQTLTENNDSANIKSAIPIGPNMIINKPSKRTMFWLGFKETFEIVQTH